MNDTTGMDVLRILEICRDIELYAAELYQYYGEIFSDNREIAKLWQKTALEEENHASQFILAISLRKQGIVQAVSLDLGTAEAILHELKALYGAVRKTRPTITEALRTAIKLEQNLAEYHLSTLALFQEESHKKLFEAMMKNDHGHVVELEKALQDALASQ
jgi:rubrerythrin